MGWGKPASCVWRWETGEELRACVRQGTACGAVRPSACGVRRLGVRGREGRRGKGKDRDCESVTTVEVESTACGLRLVVCYTASAI